MKKLSLLLGSAVGAFLIGSAAQATTYDLTITGVPGTVTGNLTPGTGHAGYTGGPDQTWGEGSLSVGGWLDFYEDGSGEVFGIEGSPVFNALLTSTTQFFTLTGSPGSFDLVLDYGTYSLTDGGTLTVGVPEPMTWTLMLLGIGGLGMAMRARRKSGVASAIA